MEIFIFKLLRYLFSVEISKMGNETSRCEILFFFLSFSFFHSQICKKDDDRQKIKQKNKKKHNDFHDCIEGIEYRIRLSF